MIYKSLSCALFAHLYLDYSSEGLGNYGLDGTVEMLSIVIATSKILEIPASLLPFLVQAKEGKHIPFELARKVIPEGPDPKERAPKGTFEARPISISQLNTRLRSSPRLAQAPKPTRNNDKPYYTYFDIIALKTGGVIGQTSAFVKEALELLRECGLFSTNGLEEIKMWSDGCGKVLFPCLINCHRLYHFLAF